jgi:hypothetical protein
MVGRRCSGIARGQCNAFVNPALHRRRHPIATDHDNGRIPGSVRLFLPGGIKTCAPAFKSALSPGTRLTITASVGTTIVFSPSLYFTCSVFPSTFWTCWVTAPLVIVLLGIRSQG